MKKTLCLLLALLLTALCAVSLGDDPDEIPGTVDVPSAGLRFVPPASFRDTAGLVMLDGTLEISDGIYFTGWMYCAMTAEEWNEVMSNHDPDAPAENRIASLFAVVALGDGLTFETLNALTGNAIPAEYVREIGRLGDYSYYLYMEDPNRDFIGAIDPAYRDEYAALASAVEEVSAAFSFYEPQKSDPYASLVGAVFTFTASDLEGNPVSSEELFARNEITLVNIWTSWCGPCIGELPELQALHVRLGEDSCGIVGMLADEDLDTARQLIADNGVAYPVVLAPDTLYDFCPLEYVPTTLFVGRDGTVLAAPVVGACVTEYENVIHSLLGR